MFAYCGNNPVVRYDDSGTFWKSIFDKLINNINSILHKCNSLLQSFGINTAAMGASLLDMTKDYKGVYHASFDCWQQYFGYNDLYDIVFSMGTSMKSAKFIFSYKGQQYVLWAWKGDYINLGAGAELGIYYGGGVHWFVDKSLAMSMSLTLKYNGETIISYNDTTWWITGFNPKYQNVSASRLTATFTVFFTNSAMFYAFKNSSPKGWVFSFGNLSATYIF